MVKNPPINVGDIKDTGSIPRLGRSPGKENGNPLQYSCLGNPMDRGTWWATVPRVSQSQTQLNRLSRHARRVYSRVVQEHSPSVKAPGSDPDSATSCCLCASCPSLCASVYSSVKWPQYKYPHWGFEKIIHEDCLAQCPAQMCST